MTVADKPEHVFIGINRIDEATITGGSWPTLTLANLQDRRLSRVARSADALTTSTIIDIDLSTVRALRAVALINHNLSQDANWRVTIGSSSGGSDVYDTGWQGAWAMTFDSEMIEWAADNWWGGIADSDYLRHPWIICAPMIAYYSGQYVRIEIDDTTNADGYVQIGRVFVGGGFVSRYNAQVNIAEGWNDRTTITTGPSGVEFIDEQRRSRYARFSLPRLELEDFKRVFELQRRLGIGAEVLFLPNTYSLQEAQRRGFLGRLRELNALESVTTNVRSVSFHIGETL